MRHQTEFDIPKSELRRIIDEWIYNPLHAEAPTEREREAIRRALEQM